LGVLIGAFVAIAALYRVWIGGFAVAVVTFEVGLEESALLEVPIVGSLVARVSTFVVVFPGAWLPIAVLVAVKLAF
jgi:hypothetical protein